MPRMVRATRQRTALAARKTARKSLVSLVAVAVGGLGLFAGPAAHVIGALGQSVQGNATWGIEHIGQNSRPLDGHNGPSIANLPLGCGAHQAVNDAVRTSIAAGVTHGSCADLFDPRLNVTSARKGRGSPIRLARKRSGTDPGSGANSYEPDGSSWRQVKA